MTREEAKEKLYMEWQKFLEDNIDYAGISEAYKMAIKALEQEPCEDAISRQEVLNQIFYSTDNSGDVVLGSVLRRRIENLPSVRPQEPFDIETYCKEHFCVMVDKDVWGKVEKALEQEPTTHGYMLVCPNCGLDVHSDFKTCPRCGAKMESEET